MHGAAYRTEYRAQGTAVSGRQGALLVFLPSNGIAQEKTLKQQIQGVWQLASCEPTFGAATVTVCVNNPTRNLILSGTGRYIILAGDEVKFTGPNGGSSTWRRPN